jgi:hypothetical protein
MTVASEVTRVSYPGPGAGPFAIPFKFFSFDDLAVIVRAADGTETELVKGAGYTGSGERNASGTLTLTVALLTGESVTIVRDPALTQTSTFRNQSAYFGSSHEDALDRVTMQLQAVSDDSARAIKLPISANPDAHSLELTPETGKVLGWSSPTAITNMTLDSGAVGLPGEERTVETLTAYLLNNATYNVQDYGAVNDGDSAKAAANSEAIQAAVNAAKAQGGGVVRFPGSRGAPAAYCIDTPIVVPAGVSLVGDDRYASIVQKVTTTPSPISDPTTPVYQFPTPVGHPICAFHFRESASIGYSYGVVQHITVLGDTADASTTTTEFGFFFNGMSNAVVRDNVVQYCKVGFFWGSISTIMSEIASNSAGRCHRGFYQHFMTGTSYRSNYAVLSRYIGHDLSAYYSDVSANGCDSGGKVGSGRAASTETFYAYKLYASRGVTFEGNGAEGNNGAPLWLYGNLSISIKNNVFLDITSDHTGSELYALNMELNYDLTVEDNRFVWSPTKLSGAASGAQHFNWRVTGQNGYHVFRRNRFVDTYTDVVDAGWTNTSGTIAHAPSIDDRYSEQNFVPGLSFDTPGNLAVTYGGSNAGRATVHGNHVDIDIDLDVTTMTFTTATGILRITGIPIAPAAGPPSVGAIGFMLGINSPAGRWITVVTIPTTQYLILAAHATGSTSATISMAHVATGTGLRLQLSIRYRI